MSTNIPSGNWWRNISVHRRGPLASQSTKEVSFKRMSKDEEIFKVHNTRVDEDVGWCRPWPFLPGSARFFTGRYYWEGFLFYFMLKKKWDLFWLLDFHDSINIILILHKCHLHLLGDWYSSKDYLRWVQSSFQTPTIFWSEQKMLWILNIVHFILSLIKDLPWT